MNEPIKKTTAKDASHRIDKRSYYLALGWKSEKNLIYAWILLLILSIVLTFIIHDWGAQIRPLEVQANVGISVTRLDREELEVLIISLEKNTDIEYLTYYSSHGSGYINKSGNMPGPVHELGDVGIIPVSGYNEKVEIFATLRNETIKIYSKIE